MDLTEEELMEIFDEIEEEDELAVPENWTSIASSHAPPPVPQQIVVELMYGDDEWRKILQDNFKDLDITIKLDSPSITKIMQDLAAAINPTQPRKTMMKNYSKTLQSEYNFEDLTEIDVKRILTKIFPIIINKVSKSTSANSASESNTGLTNDDKEIVRYHAGGLLKWGLKRFNGENNTWCRGQVATGPNLHNHYRMTGRAGGLTTPSNTFFSMVLKAERLLRPHLTKRYIPVHQLALKVDPDSFYPDCNIQLLLLLIERYIRMRVHISCTRRRTELKKRQVPKSAGLLTSIRLQSKKH